MILGLLLNPTAHAEPVTSRSAPALDTGNRAAVTAAYRNVFLPNAAVQEPEPETVLAALDPATITGDARLGAT